MTGESIQIFEDNKRTARLYSYASLKADEDRRVAPNQESKQKAQDVFTALGEATAWTNPEIVALGAKKVNAFIAADPVLKKRFAFGLRLLVDGIAAHSDTVVGSRD